MYRSLMPLILYYLLITSHASMKNKPNLLIGNSYNARLVTVKTKSNASARIIPLPSIQSQIIQQHKQKNSYSFDTASNAIRKSLYKSEQMRSLEQEEESLRHEIINVHQDYDLWKEQIAKMLYLQSVDRNIPKPRITANDSIITIEDDDSIKKYLDVLPKMIMMLNLIKKLMALLSTAFLIDCKLTGEGHFGIQCLDQVHVISVDNSFDKKPFIMQNGQEVSIDKLNEKDECLLPLCSCIHPSTLRYHSLRHPELYERCFTDQCNNPNNICLHKPNKSKCQMRHRMCIDINDWCGNPSWYPSDLPPAKVEVKPHGFMEYGSRPERPHWFHTGEVKISKHEFEINCNDGRSCCRILLGPDITKTEYEREDYEWVLQWLCGNFHQESKRFLNFFDNGTQLEIAKRNWRLKFAASVYNNRADVHEMKMDLLKGAWVITGTQLKEFKRKCVNEGILRQCEKAISNSKSSGYTNDQDVIFEDIGEKTKKKINRFAASKYTRYYTENNLCLKVLFTKT